MSVNPVKEKLARGEPSIGTWSASADPTVIETLTRSSLDWVTLDFEHNPIDVSTAVNCLRAANGTNKPVFARVPNNDPTWIKRVLDIGFWGVVVPDVKTPEQAAAAVRASRYRPDGERGIGSTRGQLVFGSDYFKMANELVTVIVMIEDGKAVDNIDAILAVPGVDVAFIGPNDLASTLGVPTGLDNKHPDHVAAVQKVIDAGKRHGVPTGIHCIDGAEVSRRIAQGMQWMPIASDVRVIKQAFEEEMKIALAPPVEEAKVSSAFY